jgi:hypothetical protein
MASIDAKLDELISALKENTATAKAFLAATGGKTAAPAAAAPAAEAKKGPGRPPKVAAVATIEATVEAANRYMEANGKAETRALLTAHGAEKGSTATLPEGKRAGFIEAVNAALAEEPEVEPEGGDEDEI